MSTPRAIWIMVPAGIVQQTIDSLVPLLDAGDILIDGGNSYYRDDIHRAAALKEKGIHYVDCGTSGGVWGLERGFCLMIGGEDAVVSHLDPIFRTIAPGAGSAEPTPGRTRTDGTAQDGYLHCGPNGAGHFVKMVHNGIEYGMMAAIAEGLSIIKHANVGLHERRDRRRDHAAARSLGLPVRDRRRRGRRGVAPRVGRRLVARRPHRRRAGQVAHARGVRRSRLRLGRGPLDRARRRSTRASPHRSSPPRSTSGSSRAVWVCFTDKVLSAMRNGFGGHDEKPA